MDSLQVPSERSETFADAPYDPDLEARLYAEIYYSNDTYTEDCQPSNRVTPSTADVSPNAISSLSVEPSDRTSSPPQPTSAKGLAAPTLNRAASGDYRYAKTLFPRRCRLLARENLWSRKKDASEPSPAVPEPAVPAPAERRDVTTDDATRNEESVGCDGTPHEPGLSKEKRSKAKKRNKHPFRTQAFRGTAKLRRRHDAVTRARESVTSKYGVVSKKTKLNMKEGSFESVGISSDSDDSILEVPVPPKAQPVVIQLVDSEEEGPRKERADPAGRRDETSTEDARSDGTVGEPSEDATSIAAADDAAMPLDNDLILNCTSQRPGPSNREKTGTSRRTGASGCTQSDDSMTESEANNWSNIAAGDSAAAGTHERSSVDKSMDQCFGLLWDQLSLDNPPGGKDSNDPSTNASVEVDTSLNDCREEDAERNKRKRTKHSNARSLDDSNVSEIPEKRSRGNTSEACTSKSLVEYFFTPMSKELRAFYNNPCGNESMDLYDIQRRMPRHPRYWTILDADLRPSPKRRGKVCPYCKNNAHFGRRCPEKSLQPICFMCGLRGHAGIRCPQTMCLTCGHEYTSFRQTCCRCFKLTCSMCNGMGHTHENCPDLWRRYHDTTTESQPTPKDFRNTMKSSQNLSCCNCAERGHDATMCKQLRWSQHFPTPTYVTSYTDGPIYPQLRQNAVEDCNSCDRVEIVQIADDDSDRVLEPPNSVFQPRVIFQSSRRNYFETPGGHSRSIRLDTLENVHLEGLLSGALKPSFLLKLKNFFNFSVRIVRKADDLVVLDICSKDEDALTGMEKLLMQWLSRSDEEKPRLRYDLQWINDKKTKAKLRRNLAIAKNTSEPLKLVEKLSQCEKMLSAVKAKLNRSARIKNIPPSKKLEWEKKAKVWTRRIISRQNKLTLSLYTRGLMNDNGQVFSSFCDLANRLINSPSREISIRDYTDLLYRINELFAFRKSDATHDAIEKLKLGRSSVADISPREIDDAACPISEVTGNGADPDNRRSCENGSVGTLEPRPVYPVANGLAEDRPVSKSLDAISHLATDKIHLENSSGTLLLNYYRRMEPTPDKSTRGKTRVCLLADLPKKKRKLYRRSAREAMGLANNSNVPWLRKLAQRLAFKMNDGTVQTSDVHTLQGAIANTLSASETKAKGFAGSRAILPRKARTRLRTNNHSSEVVTNAH